MAFLVSCLYHVCAQFLSVEDSLVVLPHLDAGAPPVPSRLQREGLSISICDALK